MTKPKRGRPPKLRGTTKAYALRLPSDLYQSVRKLAAAETRRAKERDDGAAVVSINDVVTAALRSWVAHRK